MGPAELRLGVVKADRRALPRHQVLLKPVENVTISTF